MFVNGFLIFAFRNYFGRLYTNDSRVLILAPALLIFSACVAFLDGIQAFLGGIMRGAGTPHAGTVLNLFGYYVVGGSAYFL
jgi:Na+-driven multidrug efflux pump